MHDRKYNRSWRLFVADLWGVSPTLLNDDCGLERVLKRCLAGTLVTAPAWLRHRFEPQGVSLFAFGEQFRLAVHTWPELRSATFDLWTPAPAGELILERCAAALGGTARRRPLVADQRVATL